MNYTDGMFHSDYLMQLRHMGQKLAEKQIHDVKYDDIDKKLDTLSDGPGFSLTLGQKRQGSALGTQKGRRK